MPVFVGGRFDGVEKNIEYYAALDTHDEQSVSSIFKTNSVVEKVGSGDCFMAGLIYGISSQHQPKSIISFAAAAAFGKLQEQSDATKNNIAQIQKILETHQIPEFILNNSHHENKRTSLVDHNINWPCYCDQLH